MSNSDADSSQELPPKNKRLNVEKGAVTPKRPKNDLNRWTGEHPSPAAPSGRLGLRSSQVAHTQVPPTGKHPSPLPNAVPQSPTGTTDRPPVTTQEAVKLALKKVLNQGERLAVLESQVVAPDAINLLQANVDSLVKASKQTGEDIERLKHQVESQAVAPDTIHLLQSTVESLVRANKQKDEEIEHLKLQLESQKDMLVRLSSAVDATKAEPMSSKKRKPAPNGTKVRDVATATQKAWDAGTVLQTISKGNHIRLAKGELVMGRLRADSAQSATRLLGALPQWMEQKEYYKYPKGFRSADLEEAISVFPKVYEDVYRKGDEHYVVMKLEDWQREMFDDPKSHTFEEICKNGDLGDAPIRMLESLIIPSLLLYILGYRSKYSLVKAKVDKNNQVGKPLVIPYITQNLNHKQPLFGPASGDSDTVVQMKMDAVSKQHSKIHAFIKWATINSEELSRCVGGTFDLEGRIANLDAQLQTFIVTSVENQDESGEESGEDGGDENEGNHDPWSPLVVMAPTAPAASEHDNRDAFDSESDSERLDDLVELVKAQ